MADHAEHLKAIHELRQRRRGGYQYGGAESATAPRAQPPVYFGSPGASAEAPPGQQPEGFGGSLEQIYQSRFAEQPQQMEMSQLAGQPQQMQMSPESLEFMIQGFEQDQQQQMQGPPGIDPAEWAEYMRRMSMPDAEPGGFGQPPLSPYNAQLSGMSRFPSAPNMPQMGFMG